MFVNPLILCTLHFSTGVLIGAYWDPTQLEIPEQLEVFSCDVVGFIFGAYPHCLITHYH